MSQYVNGTPEIGQEDRRDFLKVVGLTGAVAAGSEFTLSDLRGEVAGEEAGELAAMGEAIRSDLAGELSASLLGSELAALEGEMERLDELRAMGAPAQDSTEYQQLAEPGWAIHEHLVEVGFFESVEEHLPEFTAEHIASTAREFINTTALASALSELGYSEQELTSIVVNVVNNKERLAMWVPTKNIPAGVEGFDPENIAPLHQRASAGVLLWTDYLDTYLWQNEILLTDTILDDNYADLKQMYAGLHLLASAAEDLAGAGELSDAQLTAALSAGAAMAIVGQEDLTNDVMRITDEMRAPSTLR
jgi:hypothetical protein